MINAVGYDTEQQVLNVEFKNSTIYSYSGVDEITYNTMMNAESVGRYFIRNVKDVYPFKRVL